MEWTFMSLLMLFGSLQGLLIFSILICKKEDNKKARLYLSLILFGLSMNLIYYFFSITGLLKLKPFLRLTYLPWSMLSAISFYLYIVFTAPFQKNTTTLNKLGFVPFVFFSIVIVGVKWYNYFSLPAHQINRELVSKILLIEEYFGIVFTFFIGYLSYKKLNSIETVIKEQFSNYNKSKLQFHRRLIIIVLVFCVIWFAALTYAQINNMASMSIYFSIWLFMTFVIHWIAWSGFIKDDALLPVFKKNDIDNPLENDEKFEQINKSKINKNNQHYKDLIYLFEKEQFFLKPELSLEILSNKLGISKSYLSAIINQTTNKDFYHFVNSYRTEYLISLFKANKNREFTILSLAYDAGFNSKSTFQAFFKKYKGKTPSQFIKTL
jgi:AraC-like DNA-binding protein